MNAEDKKVLKVISFNSMIVRLKELPENNYTKSMMFQFYDSPIKSLAKRNDAQPHLRVSILW